MPHFRILDATGPTGGSEWLEWCTDWPSREVFAHPGFVALFAEDGARPVAATYEDHNGRIIFPIVLRPISGLEWGGASAPGVDAVGPYGYGGAFRIGRPNSEVFWDLFDAWAAQARLVSLFTRLHLFRDDIVPFRGETATVNANVVRTLDLSGDDLWMDYEHKVRKNVKKARRSGLAFEVDKNGDRLEDFLRIYSATLDRRGADDWYGFSRHFFERLIALPGPAARLFHVLIEGAVISTELVLSSAKRIYSFLGGTDSEFSSYRPNDLLKHELINWAISAGFSDYVLGGGLEKGDGIFRYKRSFAPNNILPFRVGTRIFQAEAYRELVDRRRQWEAAQGRAWNPKGDYFPAYRAPAAECN